MSKLDEELGIIRKKAGWKMNDGLLIVIVIVVFILVMIVYKPALNFMLKGNYENYFQDICENPGAGDEFARSVFSSLMGNVTADDYRIQLCADGGGCFKHCRDRCEKWQKIENTFDYFFGIEKQKCYEGSKCVPVCICPYGQIITGNLTTKDWRCVEQ